MTRAICLLVCAALPAGCDKRASQSLPDDPEQLVIYSLDGPYYHEHSGALGPDKQKSELFHDYPVLGKVVVRDPEKRRAVIRSIKEASLTNVKPATKFIPRHAIGTIKDGVYIEMVISFQFENYRGYRETKSISDNPLYISKKPEELLDQILTEAGVPLATKVKHQELD